MLDKIYGKVINLQGDAEFFHSVVQDLDMAEDHLPS